MLKAMFAAAIALAGTILGATLDQRNVPYAIHDGKQLLLDVHVPDGPGPLPAAILIHGGGFDGGSKSTNVKPLFEPLANAGFVWFSIDYRLAPEAKFPQVNEDVKSAIAWVKANASMYRVDVSRIVLIGESAGGFLVNYAGTHEGEDGQVAAVVDFYGPSDYGKLAEARRAHPELFDMVTIGYHAANGGGIHFFGVDELNDAGVDKLRRLAPIEAVHKGMPPFLCIHGTKDDQVSFDQSTAFCDAIRQVGSDCQLITIEGGAHGMSHWTEPEMQHWNFEMVAWLRKTLHIPERSSSER